MNTLDYEDGPRSSKYELPRDLIGYGENSLNSEWPNGARIAISFVLNYEEGSESCIINGDDGSEAYIWERCGTASKQIGERSLTSESDFEYGSRVGAWRILRLFREFNYPMTVYAVAQAFVKNPGFAKACVRNGHEIANHGLRWLDWKTLSDTEQVEMIKKAILLLKECSGEVPVGAYMGRGNIRTPALVSEAHKQLGLPLLWESDCYNDDVPYWRDLPQEKELPDNEKQGLLMIPYSYTTNDLKFVSSSPGSGFSCGLTYEDYLKQEFDQLYREGGKLMNVPMHSRIVGKPGRANALRSFMKYISSKEGVWVCRRRDIAKHFESKFPYVPGNLELYVDNNE